MSQKILNELTQVYHDYLYKKQNQKAYKYFTDIRGINDDSIKYFKLGYCNYNIGREYLLLRYPVNIIKECAYMNVGKKKISDLFNKRVTIPSIFKDDTSFMTSRTIFDNPITHLHQQGTNNTLFNLQSLVGGKTIVIVESPLDAITLHQNGINAIATYGVNGHIDNYLTNFQGKMVFIAYDYDVPKKGIYSPGLMGAYRLGGKFFDYGYDPYIIKFPTNYGKMDANLFFKVYKKQDFIDLMDSAELYSSSEYNKKRSTYSMNNKENSYGTVPIEIVAKRYFSELKPTRRGFKCVCPFHLDDSPSLHIFTDKNDFYCFGVGCGMAGDAIELCRKMESMKGNIINREEAFNLLGFPYKV